MSSLKLMSALAIINVSEFYECVKGHVCVLEVMSVTEDMSWVSDITGMLSDHESIRYCNPHYECVRDTETVRGHECVSLAGRVCEDICHKT